LIGQLCFLPVLTAHPSEAKRRTIKGALRNIFVSMEALDDPRLRGGPREDAKQQLANQIQILWKTDEVRTPSGRARRNPRRTILLSLVPVRGRGTVLRNLTRAVRDVYGEDAAAQLRVSNLLRFGSWIGGDRDGHPLVTARSRRWPGACKRAPRWKNTCARRGAERPAVVLAAHVPALAAFTASLEQDAQYRAPLFWRPNRIVTSRNRIVANCRSCATACGATWPWRKA